MEKNHFAPSIGSIEAINGVKKIFNALSALLGHFKVWLFRYFQGVFKNSYTHPKMEKIISRPQQGP